MILNRATIGAAIAFALAGLMVTAYVKGHSAGKDACEARWAQRLAAEQARAEADGRRAQQMADELGRRISDEISRITIEHKTVTQTIREEIREVPAYGECRISERMLDTLNAHRAAPDPGALP